MKGSCGPIIRNIELPIDTALESVQKGSVATQMLKCCADCHSKDLERDRTRLHLNSNGLTSRLEVEI
jgi:hypothetical protein